MAELKFAGCNKSDKGCDREVRTSYCLITVPHSCSKGGKIWKFDPHKLHVPARKGLNAKKQKELTFYNISRHVVKSNCGSSFPGAVLICTYLISFQLKQGCDNNIVTCSQMIYRGAVLFETSFQSSARIKGNTLYRELTIYMFFSFYIATISPPTRL